MTVPMSFDDPGIERITLNEMRLRRQAFSVARQAVTVSDAERAAEIARRYPTLPGNLVESAVLLGLDASSDTVQQMAIRHAQQGNTVFDRIRGFGKGVIRTGFLAWDSGIGTLLQMNRASVHAEQKAGRGGLIRLPFTPQWYRDFGEGMELAGQPDGVLALEELVAGREVNVGTGFFAKSDPDAPGALITETGRLQRDNLERLAEAAGRDRLVLDLSCAPDDDGRYVVATDRWQKLTDFEVCGANLEMLAAYCFEFLIHAIQVEGRQQGIDERLVTLLGDTTPLPTTYAGGVRSMEDVDHIESLGQGRLDYTVGSALDLFGGCGVRYEDLVTRHRS